MKQRRRARIDQNQSSIVSALKSAGCRVWVLGLPVDLLVGIPARKGVPKHFVLLEVKGSPAERLTDLQMKFFFDWEGYPVYRVNGIADAMDVCLLPSS